MDMEVEVLSANLGAEVSGIDLRDIAAVREVLPPLLVRHGVLVIRNQPLSRDELWGLATAFGDTTPHPNTKTFKLASKKRMQDVDHDRERPPEDTGFHSDYTFNEVVAEVGILQAKILPNIGGDTVWTDMRGAFEALSTAMQDFCLSLTVRHGFTDHQIQVMRDLFGDDYIDKQPEYFEGATHPLVVEHPVTKDPVLYASPGYSRSIIGLSTQESDALLKFIFAHINQPRFHFRLHWSLEDVGIWDEIGTAHQGPVDYWPERRKLVRATAGLLRPEPAMAGLRTIATGETAALAS